MAKFQKTSLQVSPTILHDMDHWPGITRSEALRLSVERGHYLSTINSENTASLADEYAPILREALEDLDYEDYRLVSRSLPAIVQGFISEQNNRSWRGEVGDQQELDPYELLKKLSALSAAERMGILDCAVAERHRRAARAKEASK